MKTKTIYICKECGAKSAKWLGRCNSCGAWSSFEEETVSGKTVKIGKKVSSSKIVRLNEISHENSYRQKTKIAELDRVLGGGIIPGSLILVGGDPGIGKSTLMLQMCPGLEEYNPLYVSGEESLQQIKFRSARLKGISENLMLLAETNLESIIYSIKKADSRIAIVDSIQSIYSDRVEAAPGSVGQVRECTSALMQTAKETDKAIFIIGHVTKDGIIAGPKMLEHMVDTVLQFEGEKTYSYRILRAHKNRFGSTNEIGIFEMGEDGLRQVTNPSELFLAQRKMQDSGVAIVAAIEGTRPILLEVQALVSPTGFAVPQRTSTGFDTRRLNMLLAVLEKRLGENFRQHDVFLNIAGGLRLNDPSADMGIAAALVSSLRDMPIDDRTVMIGEIGLTGEVRQVSGIDRRIGEAEKLGFERVFAPNAGNEKLPNFDIKIEYVDRIALALSMIF